MQPLQKTTEMQGSDRFDKYIKERIFEMGEETPPAVWNNLSAFLDEQHARSVARRNRAILSSVLAFLCFITFTAGLNLKEDLISRYENGLNRLAVNKNENSSFFKNTESFTFDKLNSASISSDLFITDEKHLAGSISSADMFSDRGSKQKSSSSFLVWKKQQAFTFDFMPGASFDSEEEMDLIDEAEVDQIVETMEEDEKEEKKKVKLPYVVVSYLLSNNWLLNHDTFNAFGEKDLNQNKLTISHNFGFGIGYALSPEIDIQTDVLLKARNGQQYQAYSEGYSFEKDMRLRYTRVQVIVKKKKEIRADEKYVNIYGGAYYARLNSASVTNAVTTLDASFQYRKNDLGLVAGVELERKITKKLNLVTGLVASYGLTNAYAGTDYEPASFNKTHNFYAGISLGLKYQR